MNWTFLQGNWVLCPPNPKAIIHFLGGAFVASAPQLTYAKFLEALANRAYCIITPPFLVQPNHQAIATEVIQSFQRTQRELHHAQQISFHLPTFGIGHSLGSKLQLLLSCDSTLSRAGNILISFNNASSDRAIPFLDWIPAIIPLQFSPNPEETLQKIQTHYHSPHTLVLRFKTDNLDESQNLTPILTKKFPKTFMHQTLPGDHLTPLSQAISMNTTTNIIPPIGAWLNGDVLAKFSRLEQITVKWLDYQQQCYKRSRKA